VFANSPRGEIGRVALLRGVLKEQITKL